MSDGLVINEIYLSLQGESTFAGLPCIFVRLTACDLRCSYCDTAYAFKEGEKKSLDEVRAEVHRLAKPFNQKSPVAADVRRLNSTTGGTPGASEFEDKDAPSKTHSEGRLALTPALSPGRGRADGRASPLLSPEQQSVGTGTHVAGHRLPLVELTGGEPLLQKNARPLMKQLCDDGFTVLLETSGAHDISKVDCRVRRIMDLKCPSSGEAARNRWANLEHLKATDEIKFVIGTVEDYEWAKQQIAEHNLAAVCLLLFSWVHPLSPEQQDKSLKKVPSGQTPISRQELAERVIADALPVRFQIQLHKVIWTPERRGV